MNDVKRLLWRKWVGKLTVEEEGAFDQIPPARLFDEWCEMLSLLDDEAPGVIDEERDEFVPGWDDGLG